MSANIISNCFYYYRFSFGFKNIRTNENAVYFDLELNNGLYLTRGLMIVSSQEGIL